MRASKRQEVDLLLGQLSKGKTFKKLMEKYQKTGALSKKDVSVLKNMVKKRSQEAA